jgi:hypothetical protein
MDEWVIAAHREGVMANLEAAQEIQDRTRRLLTRLAHSPGTKTPSPKGSPPAMISGTLAASIQAEHDGDDAIVGPTRLASSKNGPYGRFLELGGTHAAHNPSGQMSWFEDGRWWQMAEVEKAERPYLKPATEDAIRSGAIYQIYYDRWLIAQQAVT